MPASRRRATRDRSPPSPPHPASRPAARARSMATATTTSPSPMSTATARTRSSGARQPATTTAGCSTAWASAMATPSTWPTCCPTAQAWRSSTCMKRKAPTPGTSMTPARARCCSRAAPLAWTTAAVWPPTSMLTIARVSSVRRPTLRRAAVPRARWCQSMARRSSTSAFTGTATCRRNCWATSHDITAPSSRSGMATATAACIPSATPTSMTSATQRPATTRRARPACRPTSWATGARRSSSTTATTPRASISSRPTCPPTIASPR